MFKTELHCHSVDVSFCADVDVDHIVGRYVDAGYSSIVLANHFEAGTMRRRGDSYEQFVMRHVEACEKLRRAADGRLEVIFGAELRFTENINDYLLYGATPEFLLAHPDIFEMRPRDFSPIAREAGVLFVQAHPFRNGMTVINPTLLDGVEVFNGHIGHDSRNAVANAWADMHSLIKTSGTDYHHPHHFPDAGILTEKKIVTAADLVATLRSGEYELVRDESGFSPRI